MSFSENLKKARESKGITMADLAECANIAPQQIAKYESGISFPNIVIGVAIAKRLGTTAENLVEG